MTMQQKANERMGIRDNIRRLAILFVICCFMFLPMFPACQAKAADISPTASNNLVTKLSGTTRLAATANGYMRVFFDGEKIAIEYYDDNFQIQSKKSVKMELNVWGGFYAGSDAYYLVEGQANTAESDTAEVIRVIKYDTDWNRKGAAVITGNPSVFGGEVRYPFYYGCVEAAEYNGTLYIVTGHEGYFDPMVGQGHQGFLMIAVDKETMTGSIVDADLWHSFSQYIAGKDSDLYVLEQSEGSRYTQLSKYAAANNKKVSLPVLKYGGNADSIWATSCYASVDGIAVSSDYVLCLGTSIDQSKFDSVTSDMAHNIYLTVTPTADFSENATKVKWLTNYSGGGKSFLGTKITRINDNRLLVSWEEYETSQSASEDDSLSSSILHYMFLDAAGNVVSKEFTAAAPISDCQPIVKGTKIVYCASNATMVNFYSIDAETGAFSKKGYRVAGENATWNLENGILTISGSGAMSIDGEDYYRYPVSTTASVFVRPSDNNGWKAVKGNVNKLIIGEGITDISERAFAYLDNLTEAEIGSGVKSIGKEAFYKCRALSKITIPASVTSIGEDFLWTGYYGAFDDSHVVGAEIYAPQGSYAIQYAKENGIFYKISDGKDSDKNDDGENDESGNISIVGAKVSGIKKSYVYSGREQKPKVSVKLGTKVLNKDTDYTVSYGNNITTGKATVKIEGINDYTGTIKMTFQIVPKKVTISSISSPKSKTVKIIWEKDLQANGYQIQYAGNSNFTKNKKALAVTNKSTVSKKITNLTKGKKYYVRIRAYKKIDGKKCYGPWSKSVKAKSR